MAYLDKIRFVAGDEADDAPIKVYQGYDADALNGSAGFPMVYVTAHTLAQMADEMMVAFPDSAFDKLRNAPEDFWHDLAFGGDTRFPGGKPSAVFAPDGVTPLYLVGSWTVTIVQRFDPDGGKAYNIVGADNQKVGEGHWGAWVNENATYGTPEPVGFVIDPEYWSEGRSDTPPILREQDKDKEPEAADYIVSLSIPVQIRVESADDEEQAKSLALEQVERELRAVDMDTSFYVGDFISVDDCEVSAS